MQLGCLHPGTKALLPGGGVSSREGDDVLLVGRGSYLQ